MIANTLSESPLVTISRLVFTDDFSKQRKANLPLTVELFRHLAFFILSCKPISYCRFKRIDVYIL